MEHCKKCDIAYDAYGCPLCEANDKISDLENEIDKLNDTISDMEREE